MTSPLPRSRIRNYNAQNHPAEEQHDEHPRDHPTAVSLVCAILALLGNLVAFFAVDMWFWAEYICDGLGERFLRLLGRWCGGGAVDVEGRIGFDVGLGEGCVLCSVTIEQVYDFVHLKSRLFNMIAFVAWLCFVHTVSE